MSLAFWKEHEAELIDLYYVQGLSTEKIGKIYHVNK